MTLKTLRDQLLSNPSFVVSYIVANNPGAVEDQLRSMGYAPESPDAIFLALNELLEQGREEDFRRALEVPILTDGVDSAELAVLADVAKANLQAADPDGMLPLQASVGEEHGKGERRRTGAEKSAGGADNSMKAGSGAGDGGGGSSFWSTQAASGLIQGLFTLGQGFLFSRGLYQVPTTDQPTPNEPKGTWKGILVIAVVLFLLGGVAYFILKKKP